MNKDGRVMPLECMNSAIYPVLKLVSNTICRDKAIDVSSWLVSVKHMLRTPHVTYSSCYELLILHTPHVTYSLYVTYSLCYVILMLCKCHGKRNKV